MGYEPTERMAVNYSALKHYWHIWLQSNVMNFRVNTSSKLEFVSYVVAKILRLCFFVFFVFALFRNTESLVGYNRGEVLLFCSFMTTIDVAFQLFCRGITTVPTMVRKGEYDILLTKPVSPFFLSCFKMFDIMDLVTLFPTIYFVYLAVQQLPYSISGFNIGLAAVAWICSLIMAVSLNVLISSLAFWVTEIENGVWIYRDLVYVGRFPPEVFPQTIRNIFTFVIPILLIVATPTKALTGKADALTIVVMFMMTLLLITLSSLMWKKALRRYASASA